MISDPGCWFPVVYGRTRRADRWWRVLPEYADTQWVRTAVARAVNGGRQLSHGPRFLLGQDGKHRLVAVACKASDLSETMNSDGQRELYCLVGWIGPCSVEAGERGPSLEELESSWMSWATAVYAEWMVRDWDQHESQLGEPWRPPSIDPPWMTDPDDVVGVPPGSFDLAAAYGWPTQLRAIPWNLARCELRPLIVVTGLQSIGDIEIEPGLLIAADDVSVPTHLAATTQESPPGTGPAVLPRSMPRAPRPAQRAPGGGDVWELARRQPTAAQHAEADRSASQLDPTADDGHPFRRLRGMASRFFGAASDPRSHPPDADHEPPPDGPDGPWR